MVFFTPSSEPLRLKNEIWNFEKIWENEIFKIRVTALRYYPVRGNYFSNALDYQDGSLYHFWAMPFLYKKMQKLILCNNFWRNLKIKNWGVKKLNLQAPPLTNTKEGFFFIVQLNLITLKSSWKFQLNSAVRKYTHPYSLRTCNSLIFNFWTLIYASKCL